MKSIKCSNRQLLFSCICILTVIAVFITRKVTLMHNYTLHPDESVFWLTADSLKNKILGISDEYNIAKFYPEGAFVVQSFFHILSYLSEKVFSHSLFIVGCGRVASVVCYIIAIIIELHIMFFHFNCNLKTLSVFSIISVWSLFEIEQSRYGTGESISVMFLALTIYFCCRYFDTNNYVFLLLSFAVCGMITAVKYPLVFFTVYPILILVKNNANIYKVIAALFALVIGFFMLSPKTAQNIEYIGIVISQETNSYIVSGNIDEIGGLVNHFINVIIYWTLYEGFIFAPFFFFVSFHCNKKASIDRKFDKTYFLNIIVPIVLLIFLTYNLFTKTFFLRTVFPFFNFSNIFVAIGIEHVFSKNKNGIKIGLAVIMMLFIARGSLLISFMKNDNCDNRLTSILDENIDNTPTNAEFLKTGHSSSYCAQYNGEKHASATFDDIYVEDLPQDGYSLLDKDTLIITSSFNYSLMHNYIIPITNETINNYIYIWENFKHTNIEYHLQELYPDWLYYLFGYWIKGSTASNFEFPSCSIYYRK